MHGSLIAKVAAMPSHLCSVGNENRTASDQYHAKPVRQRKPLSQEQHGKDRDEDHAQLVYGSNAPGISELQSPEIANPGRAGRGA